MANQRDPNKIIQNEALTIETVARIQTVIRGKEVPPQTKRKRSKKLVKMTIARYCSDTITDSVKDVKPDAEALVWMREQYDKNLARREKADTLVKKGKYRKPKEEHLKTGPKPGKVSQKFREAMKKLGNERRSITKQGKRWRKEKNG